MAKIRRGKIIIINTFCVPGSVLGALYILLFNS